MANIIRCFANQWCSPPRSVIQLQGARGGIPVSGMVCVSILIHDPADREWLYRVGWRREYPRTRTGRYPSGQRGQTVNLLPSASKVRILACPPCLVLGAESRAEHNDAVRAPKPSLGTQDSALITSEWAGVAQW